MFRIFISLITITLIFSTGWNRKRNSLFLKLSSRFLSAQQLHLADGSLSSIFGRTKISQNILYAEYGLTDDITLITNIPFYNNLVRNDLDFGNGSIIAGDQNSGFGDVSFGLRYGLSQDQSVVWAIQIFADFGTGDATHSSGLYTGDAETNLQFAIEMGHSFAGYSAYITASAGYNFRGTDTFNQSIANEFLFNFEIGKWILSDLLAAAKLRSVFPDGSISNLSEFAQSHYISYELEAYYRLVPTAGIAASYTGAFQVKNYFDAAIYTLGLILDLD